MASNTLVVSVVIVSRIFTSRLKMLRAFGQVAASHPHQTRQLREKCCARRLEGTDRLFWNASRGELHAHHAKHLLREAQIRAAPRHRSCSADQHLERFTQRQVPSKITFAATPRVSSWRIKSSTERPLMPPLAFNDLTNKAHKSSRVDSNVCAVNTWGWRLCTTRRRRTKQRPHRPQRPRGEAGAQTLLRLVTPT
jgi:hypothetical protein